MRAGQGKANRVLRRLVSLIGFLLTALVATHAEQLPLKSFRTTDGLLSDSVKLHKYRSHVDSCAARWIDYRAAGRFNRLSLICQTNVAGKLRVTRRLAEVGVDVKNTRRTCEVSRANGCVNP